MKGKRHKITHTKMKIRVRQKKILIIVEDLRVMHSRVTTVGFKVTLRVTSQQIHE